MKLASDFRSIARMALTGKWMIAVAVGFVASLLGGVAMEGIKINLDISGGNAHLGFAGDSGFSFAGRLNSGMGALAGGGVAYIVLAAIIMAAVYFVLGSIIEVGYAKFNLNIVDGKEGKFETLFSYFYGWKTISVSRLLKSIYIFLWALVFIIPGIIAAYSYAMTGCILAENPELTATEAIDASKKMMQGNRFRLFCLHLSFIGWEILACATLGIGRLWLTPYKQAATAAFYRDVSGTQFSEIG